MERRDRILYPRIYARSLFLKSSSTKLIHDKYVVGHACRIYFSDIAGWKSGLAAFEISIRPSLVSRNSFTVLCRWLTLGSSPRENFFLLLPRTLAAFWYAVGSIISDRPAQRLFKKTSNQSILERTCRQSLGYPILRPHGALPALVDNTDCEWAFCASQNLLL